MQFRTMATVLAAKPNGNHGNGNPDRASKVKRAARRHANNKHKGGVCSAHC